MTHLRLLTIATLLGACAPMESTQEIVIVEPVVEAPSAKGASDCVPTEVTGDGIGGTGCPTID